MTSRSVHRGGPVVAHRAVSTLPVRRTGAAPVQRRASDSWSGLDDGDPMGDVSAQTGLTPDEEALATEQGTNDDPVANIERSAGGGGRP